MININEFIRSLKKNDLNFATGVPDSLLKNLCFNFETQYKNNHIVAANEGAAIAIGIGYHLKTGKIPIIYLQNSPDWHFLIQIDLFLVNTCSNLCFDIFDESRKFIWACVLERLEQLVWRIPRDFS